ncbi:MAG: DUF1549 domain-containing protein, partial [Pirellulaceae bacterium]|nr:DUF1549 domain-containing protein [Pirellulaceae bacterium]
MQLFWVRLLMISVFLNLEAMLAAETKQGDVEFFEKKVRPILTEHCYECHSEEAGKRKGGLWLDRKVGWETGGDMGAAIVPGDSEGSLLIQSVRYESLEMPPKQKLPKHLIATLEEWVRRGAYDPRLDTGSTPKGDAVIDMVVGRQFWSFQPVIEPVLPIVSDTTWSRSVIDHFVLAKLEANKLRPAPDATRDVILRRVTMALTGLPPTIAEQDAYFADESPNALEAVVNRLLSSDTFAERWARHWLDILRYADTSGGGGSKTLTDAWRLRNYVIDSFRKDKPLNELIREHIAGDLLPFSSHQEEVDQLVATGFLVLGPHNYGGQDKELLSLEIVDEQVDTIGKAFLGMTIGCARCHDHKFDPIPTRDYYALAGIFLSTKSVKNESAAEWFTRPYPLSPKQKAEREAKEARISSLEQEISLLKEQIKASQEESDAASKRQSDGTLLNHEPDQGSGVTLNAELTGKEGLLQQLQQEKEPDQPTVMCVGEVDTPKDTAVRIRGLPRALGAMAPRGFLQVVTTLGSAVPKIEKGSGRLELANWIASDENPLTARVLANRIWQHLFGYGIVRTPDNLGTTGSLPTHPELLDYLALQLIRNDWSARKLIREIVLSRSWQMASQEGDPNGGKFDPENVLLWRAHKRRLDAESLRDSI